MTEKNNGCFHCLRDWNEVEHESIPMKWYPDGSVNMGICMVCRECFQELSAEEIIDYIKALILGYHRQYSGDIYSYEEARRDIEIASKEVRRMKNARLLEQWNKLWGGNNG